MIEKMKEAYDSNKVGAAILTDLSKEFNCRKNVLLTAKLHDFGFSFKSSKDLVKKNGKIKYFKTHIRLSKT